MSFSSWYPEPSLEIDVTATVYNALQSQTNSQPLVTASGYVIDKDNFPCLIAVSRDLEKYFPMGTEVEISGVGHYNGTYTVRDRMNRRWRRKIDILVPDSIKFGKWQNVKLKKAQ